MERRENELHRRHMASLVHVDGEPTPLIVHLDGAILVDGHRYLAAEAIRGLIDRIIDDFPYQMVQTGGIRGADIHARPFPDTLHLA